MEMLHSGVLTWLTGMAQHSKFRLSGLNRYSEIRHCPAGFVEARGTQEIALYPFFWEKVYDFIRI